MPCSPCVSNLITGMFLSPIIISSILNIFWRQLYLACLFLFYVCFTSRNTHQFTLLIYHWYVLYLESAEPTQTKADWQVREPDWLRHYHLFIRHSLAFQVSFNSVLMHLALTVFKFVLRVSLLHSSFIHVSLVGENYKNSSWCYSSTIFEELFYIKQNSFFVNLLSSNYDLN